MAQAVTALESDGGRRRKNGAGVFGGVTIFGHGNVTGIGEALYQVRGELTTYLRRVNRA